MSLLRSGRVQGRTSAPPAGLHRRRGGNGALGTFRPAVLLLAKSLLVPLSSAAPLSLWQRDVQTQEDDPTSASDPDLYLYLGIAIVLVLLGGVFAGLTIALMGQDETYLQVIATSGEGSERKNAVKVLRLLQRGKHWVLVTLLLGNVITNETLPIVLDRSLGGGWPAVLSSTVLIVIFGEIAPQSVCVRYGLSIGAFMTPFVLVLMWALAPIAWPTAKLLDWLLGEDHGTMYKKAGLKTLVQLHKTLGTTPGERLMEDEVTIINSVLDLKDKPVGDIMTPMQDVFTMSADTVLDERMMDTILSQGYSRIPIYAPDNSRNFIGMLLVKILITYDPEDAKRVRDFALATLPETAPHTSCLDIINFFQEGKSHMVLVSDFPGQDVGATGVVTLEDVIEELIGEEIIDESDVFVDVHKAIRRMAPAPRQRYRLNSQDWPLSDTELEDKDVAEGEDEPLLQKDASETVRPSLANGRGPTSFLIRRKGSTASDSAKDVPKSSGMVPVASNPVEMREHLKHLGPSNLASRPRATKFSNVKIKPGVGTIPEDQATTIGTNAPDQAERSRSVDLRSPINVPVNPDGGERTKLLRSVTAGKDAKDGAAALRAGYGTAVGSTDAPRARGMSEEQLQMSPGEASRIAEQKAQESAVPSTVPKETVQEDDKPKIPGKLVVGDPDESSDIVSEMKAPSRELSTPRLAARSGSITETHVDIGGISKMVLETNSSSSDVEDEASSRVSPAAGGADGGSETPRGLSEGGESSGKRRKKRGMKKKDGDKS